MKGTADATQARGAAPGAESWASHRERGSVFWLRVMSWISLKLGRGVSRIITYCIAAYFFLFAPRARRCAREYLRRALGHPATPMDRFRQILTFASTIHDRVFFLNGRFELFDVSLEGEAVARAMRTSDSGALLMGAHLGSFEATRALGRRLPDQQVAMAMYADNARKINAALTAISPQLKTDIIEIGSLSAMLEIRARLAAGAFVGMMGDRALGGEPAEKVMFLGAPAAFPLGPFRVAAKLRRPVCFMGGFYLGGNRYHVVFEPIADFSGIDGDGEALAAREALHRYVAAVERHCRKYPYNWFNFIDFWGTQP